MFTLTTNYVFGANSSRIFLNERMKFQCIMLIAKLQTESRGWKSLGKTVWPPGWQDKRKDGFIFLEFTIIEW